MRFPLLLLCVLFVLVPTTMAQAPAPTESVVTPAAVAWARRVHIEPVLAQAIMRAADLHRIPRSLAFAVVQVESGFDPTARSASNALGLTQILLSTARDVDPTATVEKLLTPAYNAHVGMEYLRRLLDRYQQDPRLALIAYNSGMRVADSLAMLYTSEYARVVLAKAYP